MGVFSCVTACALSITYYGELSIWLTYFYKINNILSITSKWEIGPCLVGVTVSDIYFNPEIANNFQKNPDPDYVRSWQHSCDPVSLNLRSQGGREGYRVRDRG